MEPFNLVKLHKLQETLYNGHVLHREECLELIRGYREWLETKGQQKRPLGEALLRMIAVNGN